MNFNQPLGAWNTSSITSMMCTLVVPEQAEKLNQDLGGLGGPQRVHVGMRVDNDREASTVPLQRQGVLPNEVNNATASIEVDVFSSTCHARRTAEELRANDYDGAGRAPLLRGN